MYAQSQWLGHLDRIVIGTCVCSWTDKEEIMRPIQGSSRVSILIFYKLRGMWADNLTIERVDRRTTNTFRQLRPIKMSTTQNCRYCRADNRRNQKFDCNLQNRV